MTHLPQWFGCTMLLGLFQLDRHHNSRNSSYFIYICTTYWLSKSTTCYTLLFHCFTLLSIWHSLLVESEDTVDTLHTCWISGCFTISQLRFGLLLHHRLHVCVNCIVTVALRKKCLTLIQRFYLTYIVDAKADTLFTRSTIPMYREN